MKNCRGFTIIEIAIVLVVIGLIVGTVMISGRAVIGSSETGKTISIIKEMSEAVFEFKTRYKSLPGDMKVNSEIQNLPADCIAGGANAGNDDGAIDATESACVYEHLYHAGLIRTDGVDASGKLTVVSPYGPIRMIAPANSVASGLIPRNIPIVLELSNIPCVAAQEIDRKTDDDNINTGRTRAAQADGSALASCVEGDIVPLLIVPI